MTLKNTREKVIMSSSSSSDDDDSTSTELEESSSSSSSSESLDDDENNDDDDEDDEDEEEDDEEDAKDDDVEHIEVEDLLMERQSLNENNCRNITCGNWMELRLPPSWRKPSAFRQATAIGNICNQGERELAVGSVDGQLAVFKLNSERTHALDDCAAAMPWWTTANPLYDTICCMDVGDVLRRGTSSLVVVNAEGSLFVLTFCERNVGCAAAAGAAAAAAASSSCSSEVETSELDDDERAQQFGDVHVGEPEEQLAEQQEKQKTKSKVAKRLFADSESASAKREKKTKEKKSKRKKKSRDRVASVDSVQFTVPYNMSAVLVADVTGDSRLDIVLGTFDRYVYVFSVELGGDDNDDGDDAARLVQRGSWLLKGQAVSLALVFDETGGRHVAASLQAGSFARIRMSDGELVYCSSLEGAYDPAGASTQIIGPLDVRTDNGDADEKRGSLVVVATIDGELRVERIGSGEHNEVLWTQWADQGLFVTNRCDVTGDGFDEICATTLDGTTFIVDALDGSAACLRFPFDDRVCVFRAGNLTLPSGELAPTFVYMTFTRDIFVYHGFAMPRLQSSDLFDLARPKVAAILNCSIDVVDDRLLDALLSTRL
jgi:Integrin-alpha FG-GAP repeat-containing protein 2